jgi:Fic family protein
MPQQPRRSSRRGTSPQAPHMDARLAQRLAQKKKRLDSFRPLPQVTLRRLHEDLRVMLTYHSNAIEGNSLTLRETQLVIDYGARLSISVASLGEWRGRRAV